jgi:hypothetical protein
MDFISILATVILFTTIATLVVAVATYAAYKLRERRKPVRRAAVVDEGELEPIFLDPYTPKDNPPPAKATAQS